MIIKSIFNLVFLEESKADPFSVQFINRMAESAKALLAIPRGILFVVFFSKCLMLSEHSF
jgi:hypothetical protein